MDALAIALIFVAILNLGLAGVVLLAGKGKETNRVFVAVAILVAMWTLTNAAFRLAGSQAVATAWAELSYGAGVLLGAAFLHFAWVYPERRQPTASLTSKRSVWLLGLLVGVAAFVPGLMVRGVNLESRDIETASGVYLIAAFMFLTSGAAFWTFYRNQSGLTGRRRAQARYVLFGSFLTAALGLVFNLFLPLSGNYHWVWAGPAGSLFFVGFTGYSIVAHRLFDVRVLIRHTLVYSLVLAVMAGAFAALEKGMEHFLGPLLGHQDSFRTDILAALFVGLGTEPLRRWAKDLAHRLLFKGEPESE